MRLSKIIEKIENKVIALYEKNKDSIPRYILILFILLYAVGFTVHSVTTGLHNFQSGSNDSLFTVSPVENIKAIFTPTGIGTVLFGFLMFLLFSGKGKDLLSGYKTVKDKERGIEILPEGTHGKVERSHRKDNEYFYATHTFYSFDDFKKQLAVHNRKYNNFPMRPLNRKSPADYLYSFLSFGEVF